MAKLSPAIERTLAFFQGVIATVFGVVMPVSIAADQEWATKDLVIACVLGLLIMTTAMRPWSDPEED